MTNKTPEPLRTIVFSGGCNTLVSSNPCFHEFPINKQEENIRKALRRLRQCEKLFLQHDKVLRELAIVVPNSSTEGESEWERDGGKHFKERKIFSWKNKKFSLFVSNKEILILPIFERCLDLNNLEKIIAIFVIIIM